MNPMYSALYSAIQFIPLLEIVLRVILYIAVIYILFGPLRKLVKAATVHLESQKSTFDEAIITTEVVSDPIEERTTEE
ncbi:hypothetical protein [Cellulosilyticum sp. I15G10I2]|uniref:hypothetical protein n=1 Tax=Cellulosilyticum sp. I15G10I2 TaxID=1892843 RepID=UPI00085C09A7|nr:hypothetical protein [Cellulosilyticum sp. I15G10I2]